MQQLITRFFQNNVYVRVFLLNYNESLTGYISNLGETAFVLSSIANDTSCKKAKAVIPYRNVSHIIVQ